MRNHDALHAYLRACQNKPFAWSMRDCCIGFAAGAVKAQTGVDHLEGVRPWKSMRGAANELKRRGGWIEAVSSRLPEIAPAFAKRGDVALVVGPGMTALMIVEGEMLVGVGADGLIRLPREAMSVAWSADG